MLEKLLKQLLMPGVSVLFFHSVHLPPSINFYQRNIGKQNQKKNFWIDIKVYLKPLIYFPKYGLKNYSRLELLFGGIV